MRGSRKPLIAGALLAVPAAAAALAIGQPRAANPPGLPAGWRALRLESGGTLPVPASWRRLAGDAGTVSAARFAADGSIAAYLNATPVQRGETLAGWTRFRLRHNAAEGDRDVRLVSARPRVGLRAGRGVCVVDDYATSRTAYRELACIVAGAGRQRGTVLVAAAQPRLWARERARLDFAVRRFGN